MVTPPLCDPYVAHGWGIGKSENEYLWSAKVAMENARICMWNLPVTSFFCEFLTEMSLLMKGLKLISILR